MLPVLTKLTGVGGIAAIAYLKLLSLTNTKHIFHMVKITAFNRYFSVSHLRSVNKKMMHPSLSIFFFYLRLAVMDTHSPCLATSITSSCGVFEIASNTACSLVSIMPDEIKYPPDFI